MSDTVIKIENISKQYRLGLVGTTTLRGDFKRGWHKLRGLPDPTLKIGEENKLDQNGSDLVWALRDININVQQGEVLGIIGKNGAGKSTLLKILSRVTGPTTGSIVVKGRIASLLEVGTGMHPELTGRENIFLNGAILGMTKWEIKRKLDEIIDFAGIAKYVNTPIKRYSSGMGVRLGFAIAAFLEPEILVVDEVLAVGDAEFQKKAIGKMQDVSKGGGRTVLFVSHNMTSIKSLCEKVIVLKNGHVYYEGDTSEAIDYYLQEDNKSQNARSWEFSDAPGNDFVKLRETSITKKNDPLSRIYYTTDDLKIRIEFWNLKLSEYLNLSIPFYKNTGELIFVTASPVIKAQKELLSFEFIIPGNFLNDGCYRLNLLVVSNSKGVFSLDNILGFDIEEEKREGSWFDKWPGLIRPFFEWDIKSMNYEI